MENTTETNETSTETPTQAAPEGSAAVAENPAAIGKLTPEESAALTTIRGQSQQLLAKVGEYEVLKGRLIRTVEGLEERGQHIINEVTKRLGLEEGQQWSTTADGTILLINPPAKNEEGGAEASS